MDNFVFTPTPFSSDDEDDNFFNTLFLPAIFGDEDEEVESFILNILYEIIDNI
jgi:hypothetical protein